MKEELQYIGETIVRDQNLLAENISVLQGEEYTGILHREKVDMSEAMQLRAELISTFGQLLYKTDTTEQTQLLKNTYKIGKRFAEIAVSHHLTLGHSIRGMFSFRKVIWKKVSDIVMEKNLLPLL